MQTKRNTQEAGNVLICVLGAILVLSLIGATVLQNSTTRLNASTNHVRAWKEALSAAETGGDIAFAQLRRQLFHPATQWPTTGQTTTWINSGFTNAQFPQGTTHVLSPVATFGSRNLQAQTVVEACYFDSTNGNKLTLVDQTHIPPGNPWYRLRSKGIAPLPNLKRTGMDDALIKDGNMHFAAIGSAAMQDITARGNGDSLLRKIDFNTDHFVASYGPNGDGVGKALVPVATPQIARRIEQLVSPMTPFFDAAIKSAGSFYGLGSASYIDSYNSTSNVPYDPAVKNNPASQYYSDSRHGNVEINSATATVKGSIYGDVATNGGSVTSGNPGIVYGTIDNNVPFVMEDFRPDTSLWLYQPPGILPGQLPASISSNTTLNMQSPGTAVTPVYYLVSSIGNNLTINPAVVSGSSVETYVAIHVSGDISGGNAGITVNPKVHAKIYFDGNISMKAVNVQNLSPQTLFPLSGPYAGNLQFYGISLPRDPSGNPIGTQTINLDSGGGQPTVAATFYAPSADFTFNGAPDFFGIAVCKTFYANGNITWHYDRALNDDGALQDYRIASYVEDTR
jgi:hypothetical protein